MKPRGIDDWDPGKVSVAHVSTPGVHRAHLGEIAGPFA